MRHLPRVLSAISVATVLLVGCTTSREAETPLVPAAGASPEIQQASARLASASCDHEQRCNRIGPTAEYSSRDHCMNVMRHEANKELRTCGFGIDQEDLSECLTSIGDQNCGGVTAPLDRLQRLASCSLDDLCAD